MPSGKSASKSRPWRIRGIAAQNMRKSGPEFDRHYEVAGGGFSGGVGGFLQSSGKSILSFRICCFR